MPQIIYGPIFKLNVTYATQALDCLFAKVDGLPFAAYLVLTDYPSILDEDVLAFTWS